jgi:hypothetical protein
MSFKEQDLVQTGTGGSKSHRHTRRPPSNDDDIVMIIIQHIRSKWSIGVLEYKHLGVMERWSNGVMEKKTESPCCGILTGVFTNTPLLLYSITPLLNHSIPPFLRSFTS